VEANSTGGQGSRRAVAPSDDDDDDDAHKVCLYHLLHARILGHILHYVRTVLTPFLRKSKAFDVNLM
jgi:hypothetical protein